MLTITQSVRTPTAGRFVRTCKTATKGYGGGGRSLSPDLHKKDFGR
jgi:hypothetical protein